MSRARSSGPVGMDEQRVVVVLDAGPGPGLESAEVLGERLARLLPPMGGSGPPGEDSPGGGLVLCDVRALSRPDLAALGTLARLRLTARRHGYELRLAGAGPELRTLLEVTGFSTVIPAADSA